MKGQHGRWTPDKLESVKAQRDSGMTLKAIGDVYGISVEQTRQVVIKAERSYRTRLSRTASAVHVLLERIQNNP